ncbi:MAG: hypothetical protein QOI60_532 [Actinomycetota bacterium]|nr:hypothetical protein [Actinomycetota bacterium]
MKGTPDLGRTLRRAQAADGGFGPRPGAPAEPEPTALAAVALGDTAAADWLAAHQDEDGSIGIRLGPVWNDSATALASFALSDPQRQAALDHLAGGQGRATAESPIVPHDGSLRGWAWTSGTAGWVEPTSRALLALRALRPAAPQIADGVGYLRDRACIDGGWNYGNRSVYGEDLPSYAQTTAAAMLALRPEDGAVFEQGMAALGNLWRGERSGGLTLSMTLAAATAHGDPMAGAVADELHALFQATAFTGDTVALAWGTIATGPGLDVFFGGSP